MTIHTFSRYAFVVVAPLLLMEGCSSDEHAALSGDAPCDAQSSVVEGTVVVRGTVAPCDIVFVPVVTLKGSPSGALPRVPVVAEPGGRWLTATYEAGELAVWSPSGELERLIGPGTSGGGHVGTCSSS